MVSAAITAFDARLAGKRQVHPEGLLTVILGGGGGGRIILALRTAPVRTHIFP